MVLSFADSIKKARPIEASHVDAESVSTRIRSSLADDAFLGPVAERVDATSTLALLGVGRAAAHEESRRAIQVRRGRINSVTSAALVFATLDVEDPAERQVAQSIVRDGYAVERLMAGANAVNPVVGSVNTDARLFLLSHRPETAALAVAWSDRLARLVGNQISHGWANMIINSALVDQDFATVVALAHAMLRRVTLEESSPTPQSAVETPATVARGVVLTEEPSRFLDGQLVAVGTRVPTHHLHARPSSDAHEADLGASCSDPLLSEPAPERVRRHLDPRLLAAPVDDARSTALRMAHPFCAEPSATQRLTMNWRAPSQRVIAARARRSSTTTRDLPLSAVAIGWQVFSTWWTRRLAQARLVSPWVASRGVSNRTEPDGRRVGRPPL